MSQAFITLPITVADLNSSPASIRAVSDRDAVTNPDTAQFRFTHDHELPNGPFNPWQLREDFLSWPLEDWGRFFYMAGTFGGVRISQKDFGEWQRLMRKALLLPAREWKELAAEFDSKKVSKLRASLPIHFDWDIEPPTAKLLGLTALGSMIATIQLDKLQGAEFRVCARFDCGNPPFRVGNRKKIYCTDDCAHLVAVRNSRTRAAGRAKPTKRRIPGKKLHSERTKNEHL
jgi:hypothetical protein